MWCVVGGWYGIQLLVVVFGVQEVYSLVVIGQCGGVDVLVGWGQWFWWCGVMGVQIVDVQVGVGFVVCVDYVFGEYYFVVVGGQQWG